MGSPKSLDSSLGIDVLWEYGTNVEFNEPFTLEEWYRLGMLEDADARKSTLTHPIHFIWDFAMWQSQNLCPLSVQDREVMEPVLRLASAMLMSQPSVAFMDALIYRKRQPAMEAHVAGKLQMVPGHLRYRKRLRHYVDHFLLTVRDNLDLEWVDDRSPNWVIEQDGYAFTSVSCRAKAPKWGCALGIFVNDRFLKTLHRLQISYPSPKTTNHQLRVQFLLAVTLCHELMHVIDKAWNRSPSVPEPYFGDQALNEIGFAWEEVVFGGEIDDVRRKENDPEAFELCEWPISFTHFPSPATFAGLLTLELEFSADNRRVFERRSAKGSSTVYYAPMKWITRLQQQSTWDQWGQSNNLRLLHIPKQIGLQSGNLQWSIDPKWSPTQSSEGKWPGDHQGRVYRNEKVDQNLKAVRRNRSFCNVQ